MGGSVQEEKIEEKTVSEEKMNLDIDEFLSQDSEEEAEGQEGSWKDRKIPNLYRGRALNSMELYKMTARQEVRLILVAGMFHSGKTTLEMAIYQMFLRGENKKLQFAGSRTLIDVAERSQGLCVVSENAEPEVERTSDGIEDKYLHLSVMDQCGNHYQLVFTDFAGEIFSNVRSEKHDALLESFLDQKYVLVLVDGEKLSGRGKDIALMECKSVISHLQKKQIITDHTDVHIVYTKNDKILASENPNMNEIIQKNNRIINGMFGTRKGKVSFHRTAAISQHEDKTENYSGLESLLESLLNVHVEEEKENVLKEVYADRERAYSSFEKFAWKG